LHKRRARLHGRRAPLMIDQAWRLEPLLTNFAAARLRCLVSFSQYIYTRIIVCDLRAPDVHRIPSKGNLKVSLSSSRIVLLARSAIIDDSKTGIAEIEVRVAKLHAIEHVVKLHSQLGADAFAKFQFLR